MMSIVFAYRTHDDLAIRYPLHDHGHSFFDVPDIGILPIDGTLAYRDHLDVGELVPIWPMPNDSSAHFRRSASCYWQDEHR